MRSNARKNWSINHSLSPLLLDPPPKIEQEPIQITPRKHFNPYKASKSVNPLTQRSRKHRLVQERNFEIEKINRMLYEKIRKIKLKNMFQSEKKIEPESEDDSTNLFEGLSKHLVLPQINEIKKSHKSSTTISNRMPSMNSTKSYLDSILEDRGNFIEKYFIDLTHKKNNKSPDEELGNFLTQNGWKVMVLLVDNQNVVLLGKKGRKELTKKYVYEKVKDKMGNGLEDWVRYKFSFES